jgi:asparagine synthase (glutamine-hydrolysing)
MCGIAGILTLDGATVAPPVLRRMTDAIAHRGPDGEDFFFEGPIGLGHRRLAIIDLSPAGRQPMRSHDGRFVLTYNGEIYNFGELRAELQALGHNFVSRSDSEVLIEAWAHWGTDCVGRLNGMFAFAVWDRRDRALTLVRDRYGVKPLYLARAGRAIVFGSEGKAILAHPDMVAKLDPMALAEYLTFQNFFGVRTLFAGIEIVQPGTIVRIDADDGMPRTTRYWDFAFAEPEKLESPETYDEEADRLLRQAIHRQLISDVPVGTYLSGGIDSGLIAATASRAIPGMCSFTVGFDLRSASGLESGMDERGRAEHMSYLFGTEHYEMVLKAGDMERVLRRTTWHLDEPRVGQSYPNFFAASLAAKFGKVVLAGTGGDELFGGYPWRYYRTMDSSSFDAYIDAYFGFWQRLIPDGALGRVLAPIAREISGYDPREAFRQVFARGAESLERPEDYVAHSLYFEARTFLHGLLVVEDKLSMAHGLESRVPFLDNDLVDFAMRLPARAKLGRLTPGERLNENESGVKGDRYYNRTKDGKLILRRLLDRYVPPEISGGEKRGFSAPDASWFRGESIEFVKRVIFDDRSPLWDFLDRIAVRALVDDHLQGRENRRLLIWSLLSLDAWCRMFLLGGRPV